MDQCAKCITFLVSCPCCSESFCPDCMRTETELENSKEDCDESTN